MRLASIAFFTPVGMYSCSLRGIGSTSFWQEAAVSEASALIF